MHHYEKKNILTNLKVQPRKKKFTKTWISGFSSSKLVAFEYLMFDVGKQVEYLMQLVCQVLMQEWRSLLIKVNNNYKASEKYLLKTFKLHFNMHE